MLDISVAILRPSVRSDRDVRSVSLRHIAARQSVSCVTHQLSLNPVAQRAFTHNLLTSISGVLIPPTQQSMKLCLRNSLSHRTRTTNTALPLVSTSLTTRP